MLFKLVPQSNKVKATPASSTSRQPNAIVPEFGEVSQYESEIDIAIDSESDDVTDELNELSRLMHSARLVFGNKTEIGALSKAEI